MWRSYCEKVNACGMLEIDCYQCEYLGILDDYWYDIIEQTNNRLKSNPDTTVSKPLF